MKNARTKGCFAGLAVGLLLLMTPVTAAEKGQPALPPLVIKKQGYFYTTGKYADPAAKNYMVGHMYVEYQIPQHQTSKFPIVLVHGGSQLGINYTGTVDGRPGWRDYFLSRGWPVYVIDQVGRGRSSYVKEYGPRGTTSAEYIEGRFTGIKSINKWPESQLHTQWPGSGLRGDPVFEQFLMQQDPGMEQNRGPQEVLTNDGLIALLEKIGPAVVLVHSQSGVNGWHVLDQRPNLVKALVSVEPYGPPFLPPWGITNTPLKFSPAITDASQFEVEEQATPSFPGAIRCKLQKEPAKYKLPSMAGAKTPILIVTSEASYRAGSDHCSQLFLAQAGVSSEHIKLEKVGIRGNGHMMMLEKNNLQIAALMESWLRKKLPPQPSANKN